MRAVLSLAVLLGALGCDDGDTAEAPEGGAGGASPIGGIGAGGEAPDGGAAPSCEAPQPAFCQQAAQARDAPPGRSAPMPRYKH